MKIIADIESLQQAIQGLSDLNPKSGSCGLVRLRVGGGSLEMTAQDNMAIVIRKVPCSPIEAEWTSIVQLQTFLAFVSLSQSSVEIIPSDNNSIVKMKSGERRISIPSYDSISLGELPEDTGKYFVVKAKLFKEAVRFGARVISDTNVSVDLKDCLRVLCAASKVFVYSTDGAHLSIAHIDSDSDKLCGFESAVLDKQVAKYIKADQGDLSITDHGGQITITFPWGTTTISKQTFKFPEVKKVLATPKVSTIELPRSEVLSSLRMLSQCSGDSETHVKITDESLVLVAVPRERKTLTSQSSDTLAHPKLKGVKVEAIVSTSDFLCAVEVCEDGNLEISFCKEGDLEFFSITDKREWRQLFTTLSKD